VVASEYEAVLGVWGDNFVSVSLRRRIEVCGEGSEPRIPKYFQLVELSLFIE